jgi:hypothetical protein
MAIEGFQITFPGVKKKFFVVTTSGLKKTVDQILAVNPDCVGLVAEVSILDNLEFITPMPWEAGIPTLVEQMQKEKKDLIEVKLN